METTVTDIFPDASHVDVQILAQGPQGDQGSQGSVGPSGPQGPQGPQGEHGSCGALGACGHTGACGALGPCGPQGPQGLQGPQGPCGIPGVCGPEGACGTLGPCGAQGNVGPPSDTGVVIRVNHFIDRPSTAVYPAANGEYFFGFNGSTLATSWVDSSDDMLTLMMYDVDMDGNDWDPSTSPYDMFLGMGNIDDPPLYEGFSLPRKVRISYFTGEVHKGCTYKISGWVRVDGIRQTSLLQNRQTLSELQI